MIMNEIRRVTRSHSPAEGKAEPTTRMVLSGKLVDGAGYEFGQNYYAQCDHETGLIIIMKDRLDYKISRQEDGTVILKPRGA